ncbi:hypothetical protein BGZ95_003266, partial [Linnemannia exigua]
QVASSTSTTTSASVSSSLNVISAVGQKRPRDHSGEPDEASPKTARNTCLSDESRPSSELLRTPLQSPTFSEPASPVQPFILPEDDKCEEPLPASIAIQHHADDPISFFTSTTEHQHREYLLQALHDGKQLPLYCQECFMSTKSMHISKDEILQIRRDVLPTFYINAQQEEDLKRVRAAREHWVIWSELWSSIELSASLAADQGAESTLDTTPIIDSVMAAYGDCKVKNIFPVLFMALQVFRKFNTWSRLRSETDCAMAMVGPILEEVLQIHHEVKFTR